jgi:hypothetical protein
MSGETPSKWHPLTGFYEYNYGVGINYYQPMIDYIEQKERDGATRYPHLPWTDERGLRQYDPKRIVKSYSATALDDIARRTEASAKARLRDFSSTTKSSFQLSKSVSAATITEKVQVRKKKEIVRQIKTLKSKMADDLGYDRYAERDVEMSLRGAQKYLRGRSAKAIESYLRSESSKNIAKAVDFDMSQIQRSYSYAQHAKVMDKRLLQQLELKCVEPLDALSKELKGFDRRSTAYFYDQR